MTKIWPLKPKEEWTTGTRFIRLRARERQEYMLCLVTRYTFSLINMQTGNRWNDKLVLNPEDFEPANSTSARFVMKIYPDFFKAEEDDTLEVYIGDRRIA